ncbi:glycosyltransferase [Vibrio vulnificus]|nr:glycosyltransferase [Vibrio vulnificus]EJL6392797.1 glycosyltransferase [Vibrio vulnificus]MCU8137580.1 glycosyltransferase [Vibrio vulnificus]
MSSGHVVYVGPFSFPSGGAASRRILHNCLSLLEQGYRVSVASGQNSDNNSVNNIEGIDVYSLNERNSEHLPRLLKHLSYFSMGKKTVAWLDSLEYKPKAVILYSGYSPYLIQLIKWSKRNKVKLIFDAVEWYDPPSVISRLSPYYLNIELAMRLLIPKVDGIISISSYLHDYYVDKGCQSLLMPPTTSELNISNHYIYSDACLKIAYAGSPGNKDLLNIVIDAVNSLVALGHSIELNIAGLSKSGLEDYCVKYNVKNGISDHIVAHGYLDFDESVELVSTSDFSILVRPIKRYSTAGFSTKFVESLVCGTPVIANITSDLGNYIRDNVNGIICQDYSLESVKEAIINAVNVKLEKEKYMSMRDRAKADGLCYFHYSKYSNNIDNFIQNLG